MGLDRGMLFGPQEFSQPIEEGAAQKEGHQCSDKLLHDAYDGLVTANGYDVYRRVSW